MNPQTFCPIPLDDEDGRQVIVDARSCGAWLATVQLSPSARAHFTPDGARALASALEEAANYAEAAQLEAETAAAAAAEQCCWFEWRTAAGHLTACAEPRYHEGAHRDAFGHSPQLRAAKAIQ